MSSKKKVEKKPKKLKPPNFTDAQLDVVLKIIELFDLITEMPLDDLRALKVHLRDVRNKEPVSTFTFGVVDRGLATFE